MAELTTVQCAIKGCLLTMQCPEHPNVPGTPDLLASKGLTDTGWIFHMGWYCPKHRTFAWEDNYPVNFEATRQRANTLAVSGAVFLITSVVIGIFSDSRGWLFPVGFALLLLGWSAWLSFVTMHRQIYPRRRRECKERADG